MPYINLGLETFLRQEIVSKACSIKITNFGDFHETPFHKAKKNYGICLIFITFKLIRKVLRSGYRLERGE